MLVIDDCRLGARPRAHPRSRARPRGGEREAPARHLVLVIVWLRYSYNTSKHNSIILFKRHIVSYFCVD